MDTLRRTKAIMTLALGTAVSSGACDGSGPFGFTSADTDPLGGVVEIVLSPDTVRIERIGESVQMEATALDASGAPVPGVPIRWSSSNITVATVTGEGVVVGVGAGLAQVIAATRSVEARAPVSVAPIERTNPP